MGHISYNFNFLSRQAYKHSLPMEFRGRHGMVDFLVLTSLDQLMFKIKILFTFVIKQATLMRTSTILRILLQLVYPGGNNILMSTIGGPVSSYYWSILKDDHSAQFSNLRPTGFGWTQLSEYKIFELKTLMYGYTVILLVPIALLLSRYG